MPGNLKVLVDSQLNNIKAIAIAVGVMVFILFIASISTCGRQPEKPTEKFSVASKTVPLIMHTSGGNLEVANITTTEEFTRSDPDDAFGAVFGKTISKIEVKVVYRFYIEMEKEWPIERADKSLVVRAGKINHQLPVSIDTSSIRKFSQTGWARFNRGENLDKLEQALSPLLESRAPKYKDLVEEKARKTVADFVAVWLLKHYPLPDGATPRVQVLFPGETAGVPQINK